MLLPGGSQGWSSAPTSRKHRDFPGRTGKEIQNDGTNLHFREYPQEKDHKKNPHRPDRNKNVQTA
jgi:hypothetical protein